MAQIDGSLVGLEFCCGRKLRRREDPAPLSSPFLSSLARRGESIISKDVSICPSNFRLE